MNNKMKFYPLFSIINLALYNLEKMVALGIKYMGAMGVIIILKIKAQIIQIAMDL
jgi:hypothetical protein